jgi:hypothetical protein
MNKICENFYYRVVGTLGMLMLFAYYGLEGIFESKKKIPMGKNYRKPISTQEPKGKS